MREKPNMSLDNDELTELHQIYTDLCTELGVSPDDALRIEVAAVVMDQAQAGDRDYSAIRQRTKLKLTNR